MLAADFDSLVGNFAAVGPSYYALARTLFAPAATNRSAVLAEYYSAFGPAASAMQRYFGFWRDFAQAAYTDPEVLARIADYENRSSPNYVGSERAQYVMAGEVYTASVLTTASTLLRSAEMACGGPDSISCVRVRKSRAHLGYAAKLATAAK